MIFSSFRPEQKKKIEQLRHKLKIVWQGYKYIIETVRINQKLEQVFKQTLNKVFLFVDKFNRKHEFKSFCRTLRSGLNTAFSKRDRTEQQKAIYIDIEKADVNDRNIEIRLDQFKVTIKLGLWQEAFQVLEDINNLMRVRKGVLKSSIRYSYYENLALLFKKSNYWHYHAFAFYNKFLAAQKNPKLSSKERKQLSDKLLLSVLCIPPVTHESNQSKQSQLKISSMMVSSTKIPSKEELFDIIAAAGISQHASNQVRNLWSFMLLEFDLDSLTKGLELLSKITNQDYAEFRTLVQDILIYKQLQSISDIYQRIKIDSLLSLIPLPREKIEKILLSSYHQKILDFVLDEDQKIIIFEDKSVEKSLNPTENFLSIYIDLAIEKEKQRVDDKKHILSKLQNYVQTSEEYFWNIRQYKIEEFRKKLKKPKQDLLNEVHKRKLQEKEDRQRQQAQKLARQAQAMRLAEQKKKQFGIKKIIINDIKQVKKTRVVRILGVKVQDLKDQQLENISLQTLNKSFQQIKQKIQKDKDAKYKKAFNQVDYMQRQRRQRLEKFIQQSIPSKQQQQKLTVQTNNISKKHHEQLSDLKSRIQKIMPYLKPKIQDQTRKLQQKYDTEMTEFKQRLTDYYKDKIIARAKALAKQNKEKKQQQEQKLRQANNAYIAGSAWTFKQPVNRVAGGQADVSARTETAGLTLGKKPVQSTEQQKTWNFKKQTATEQKKQQIVPTNQKWGRKDQTKKQTAQTVHPTSSNTFVPPPVSTPAKKTFGPGIGFGKKTQEKPKQEYKKPDGKPPGPKKNYVDVNK